MEIEKLKKRILREELRRRRKNSRRPLFLAVFLLLAVLAGAYYIATAEQRLEDRLVRAEALVAAGQYEEAIAGFRALGERHPDDSRAPRALFRAAEVLNVYQHRYQEAILGYLLVEKDYPESTEALAAQQAVADIYKNRLQDYGRAIVALQKLLDGGAPAGDRIQYEVADSYFRLNNFEQARIEFDSLLKGYAESPLVPEVRYRIAVAHSLEGNSKEAEKAFRALAEDLPESPYATEARFALAAVFEERDELRAALAILEGLRGNYPNAEALAKKTEQVRERIGKKKRAI